MYIIARWRTKSPYLQLIWFVCLSLKIVTLILTQSFFQFRSFNIFSSRKFLSKAIFSQKWKLIAFNSLFTLLVYKKSFYYVSPSFSFWQFDRLRQIISNSGSMQHINFFKSCKTKHSIPKLSSSTFMSHIQSQKNQFFLQNFEWIQNKLVRMVKLKLERDKPVLFKVQNIF